jgi:hypothetical protein
LRIERLEKLTGEVVLVGEEKIVGLEELWSLEMDKWKGGRVVECC